MKVGDIYINIGERYAPSCQNQPVRITLIRDNYIFYEYNFGLNSSVRLETFKLDFIRATELIQALY
jgi:hypothetical protein